MALTVAGPVGCKQGWKEGAGERERPALWTDRWRNWVAPEFSAPIGKYTLTACAIRSLWRIPREVFFDGSGDHVVPASVRLALRVLNRRADQQRLVDGVAQLNGGCGRAAQMSHRDGNDISAGSA